jgi:hypothetical protein
VTRGWMGLDVGFRAEDVRAQEFRLVIGGSYARPPEVGSSHTPTIAHERAVGATPGVTVLLCYSAGMTMSKPIALDICSREGGATKGLQRAGLYVIGVDIEPRTDYPGDEFIQADGLKILEDLTRWSQDAHMANTALQVFGAEPALIWQSWPCQEGNTATAGNRARGIVDNHEQFIPRARELSDRIGIPYVLEQPTASRKDLIRRDLTLCMDMFKGELPPPWVQKHRSFELSGFTVPQPPHPDGPVRGPSMVGFKAPAGHTGYVRGHRHGVVRGGVEAPYVAGYGKGGGKGKVWELQHAMGIDWMTDLFDLCEAIPPVFSEYIGRAFLAQRG